MIKLMSGVGAMAGVTLREMQRQRFAWIVGLVALGILAVVPQLDAVDRGAQIKLSVAAITGSAGFLITLLGTLVAASCLRRDIERRCGFTLFSKPLGRGSYLWGRWLGVVGGLLLTVIMLSAVGAFSTLLQLGDLPQPRAAVAPTASWRIINGAPTPVVSGGRAVMLAGDPARGRGEGMRWSFSGLSADDDLELYVGVGVRTGATATGSEEARLLISAEDGAGNGQVLALAADSQSGRSLSAESGAVALRHRRRGRNDLAQDYARFVVPAQLLSAGEVTIQLNRLDDGSRLTVAEDAVFIGQPSGGFALNLLRAELVLLAQAAVLVAAALALVTFGGIGTALLGTLTLYFAGHTLELIRDSLRWEDFPLAVERAVGALVQVCPDFTRFGVEAALASSRVVPWSEVMAAWGYYGIYIVGCMAIGWLGLRRVEL
ncbi:MAG: ABC transporter permease [Planctomycetota bacterium]|jgi:hypothetical protein